MVLAMYKFLLVVCISMATYGEVCRHPCRHGRTYGMKSADCYKKDLKQIPQCLKSDVEVLDLSYNRLRKIKKSDLSKYTHIKLLYLAENMIADIEEEALEDKTDLMTLDISVNSLTSIPAVIFRLPLLNKLYMSENQNANIAHSIENARPILSPLSYLDISFNELTKLPNLGIMSTLIKYNITGNDGVRLSTGDFAGLCNLKILVNYNTTFTYEHPCDCVKIESWLHDRKILFSPLTCENQDCYSDEVPAEDLLTFNNCRELHQHALQKSRTLKIAIPVCSVILLLVIAGIYFYIRRRNQRERVTNKPYSDDSVPLRT